MSASVGTEPVWSGDGRELYYRTDSYVMMVAIDSGEDLEPGRPVELFEDRFARTDLRIPNYDVSPDGRFLMIEAANTQAATSLTVVLNWHEELKRLLPVD